MKNSRKDVGKLKKRRSGEGEFIIFDCDPGIDDAIALFLFSGLLKSTFARTLPPKIYVVATWGNVPLSHTLKNAKICVELFGLQAEVVKGMEKPSGGGTPRFAVKVHGKDGLRGAQKEFLKKAEQKKHKTFSELIKELSSDSVEKIHVIATGPLSSVARLIDIPSISDKIKRVVWMGGAFFHDGNTTPWAEFNSYCDPYAVKKLFEFAEKKRCVEVVPLDATEKTQMNTDEFLSIFGSKKNSGSKKTSSPNEQKKAEISKFMEMITHGTGTITLHDPLAVFTFFFPDKVKYFISVSHVDTKAFKGKISSIITPNGFLKVVYDFDRTSFMEQLKRSYEVILRNSSHKAKSTKAKNN